MARAMTNRLLLSVPSGSGRPTDVYTAFGVYLDEECLKEVVAMPVFKSSSINAKSWAEYDGMDVEIASPVLDAQTIKLKFHCSHASGGTAERFVEFLMEHTYYTFNFVSLSNIRVLRYVSSQGLEWNTAFDTFTLTFSDDNPVTNSVTEDEPVSVQGTLTMDGEYFAAYGCMELKGTKAAFNKLEGVKERLKTSRDTINGVWYDGDGTNKTQYPDIAIPLHMRPSTITHFWRNWYGLFNDLTADNSEGQKKRILSDGLRNVECYYKKCAVNKFKLLSDGSVWVDFTLTFAVIQKTLVTTT